MPSEIDLTPCGFTPTESQAYAALLRLGPSTGYAVAHATRVARVNTYGALEGLVGRTAALRLPGRPARYRATDPAALIAQLAAQQGEALDRLSHSLRDVATPSEPETRTVTGARGWGAPPPCGGPPGGGAGPRPPRGRGFSPPAPSSPRATFRSTARGSATSTRGTARQSFFSTASAPRCTPGARTWESWPQRA